MKNGAILFVVCLGILPAAAGAQGKRQASQQSPPSQPRGPETDIDKWLTRPSPIQLTASQRKTVDSLKAAFAAEFKQERRLASGEMDVVSRTGDLLVKYRRLVRDVLTDSQRPTFYDNL